MPIKPDSWIRRMALEKKMIEPFVEEQVREGVISYGLSSYGYDLRLADEFRVFLPSTTEMLNPKQFQEQSFVSCRKEVCQIPAHSFVLARSLEYFRIPRNVMALCVGKSTYARCGLVVNVTPFEPEWEGFVTLSISNTSPAPALVHAFEGIAQVLFLESDPPCTVSYADRKGKYQQQERITLAKV